MTNEKGVKLQTSNNSATHSRLMNYFKLRFKIDDSHTLC